MKNLIKKWEESTLTELEVGTLIDQLLTNRSESIPISKIEELKNVYSHRFGDRLSSMSVQEDLQKLINEAK